PSAGPPPAGPPSAGPPPAGPPSAGPPPAAADSPADEEFLLQSEDGKTTVWLPKYVVKIDESAPPEVPTATPKRPAEDQEEGEAMPPTGGDALRSAMLAEIRNFRPKKKRSSAEDEARAKRR
ncbi:classical arabinogalactan protein 4, partial [Hyalella azteca]|uniref:Classical arabinogalactan protein 4 n=1 Tax=Hyalella azteca TaxID=294128 RepID=A0A8B7PCA6_HYAAZ